MWRPNTDPWLLGDGCCRGGHNGDCEGITFGGDGYTYCLDCGDGFASMYLRQNLNSTL